MVTVTTNAHTAANDLQIAYANVSRLANAKIPDTVVQWFSEIHLILCERRTLLAKRLQTKIVLCLRLGALGRQRSRRYLPKYCLAIKNEQSKGSHDGIRLEFEERISRAAIFSLNQEFSALAEAEE